MPSPFPGIDPYIESHKLWHDFHSRLIAALADAISEDLPEPYVARIDERLNVVEYTGEEAKLFLPDVAVTRLGAGPAADSSAQGGTITLEPVTVPLKVLEEYRETYLEISHWPDRKLVTIVELLSPSNKVGEGLRDYLVKRNALIHQEVNLVELDFLVGGQRLPMNRSLPRGDYYALVARGDRRPDCDVYAWSVRHPLPTIPIPLLPPDDDIRIALGPIFRSVYDRVAMPARSTTRRRCLSL